MGLPDTNGNTSLRTEIDIRAGGVWRQMMMDADSRCLIPANDFSVDGLRARVTGEGIFAFAGIWSPLRRQPSFAILCYEPDDILMSKGATKMPVIVDRAQYEAWLGADATIALDVLRPFPAQRLTWERT